VRVHLDTPEGCLQFAAFAHEGQVDKQGAPYIAHVARVGSALWRFGPEFMCAGYLHDVVEDTDWPLNNLDFLGAAPEVLSAVEAVTRKPSEKGLDGYRAAIERAMGDPIGKWVKAADVSDNASRLDGVVFGPVRRKLQRKYEMAERLIAEEIKGYRIGAGLYPPEVLYLTRV
jgi:hypothetical protein